MRVCVRRERIEREREREREFISGTGRQTGMRGRERVREGGRWREGGREYRVHTHARARTHTHTNTHTYTQVVVTEDIAEGEEVLIDYGQPYWGGTTKPS